MSDCLQNYEVLSAVERGKVELLEYLMRTATQAGEDGVLWRNLFKEMRSNIFLSAKARALDELQKRVGQ